MVFEDPPLPLPGSPRGRCFKAENSRPRSCSESRCLSLRRRRENKVVRRSDRCPSVDTYLGECRCSKTTTLQSQHAIIPPAIPLDSCRMPYPARLVGSMSPEVKKRSTQPPSHGPFQGCRSCLPAECGGDPSKYYLETDYMWTLLEQKQVILIRGSWLVARSKAIPFVPLPCRQDLPHDAIVDVAELRRVADHAPTGDMIVAISHSWLSPDHPDVDGKLLQELTPVIEAYQASQNDWCLDGGEYADGAFFFAWCSLYQPYHVKLHNDLYSRVANPQLTVEQHRAHQISLGNMDIWYTHSRTEVWMLTKFFPEQRIGYDDRGWPTWERTVSELVTSGRSLLDLGLLEQTDGEILDMDRIRNTCKASRRPPSLPENFRNVIVGKHFTCGEHDRARITENYARNFRHVTECIRRVAFQNMRWTGERLAQVFELLRWCRNLQDLQLGGNHIRDNEGYELAQVLRYCGKLERLHLDSNLLGDVGLKVICKALASHSNCLKEFHIQRNAIGYAGSRALSELLPCCAKLEQLILDGNQIGDRGALALASAFHHCTNLKLLLLGGNQLGDPGASALAQGLRSCNALEWLFLDNNCIGSVGAGALAKHLSHCFSLNTLLLQGNQIDELAAQLLTEALQCRNVCCVAKIDVGQSNRCITGYQLWRRTQPPAKWKYLEYTFKHDDLISPQERELWQERHIALLSTQEFRKASIDPSRFEFEFVSKVNGPCHVVGLPTSWETLKVRLNEKCKDLREFDGELLPGMVVYETLGLGPKIFGVVDAENIYYHDYGVWYKYASAVPIPTRAPQGS